MEPGKILHRVQLSNLEYEIRTIRRNDLDALHAYINSVIEEDLELLLDTPLSRTEERAWLETRLSALENDSHITLVATWDKKIVASFALERHPGRSTHVGEIGISIAKDHRNYGLGTEIMRFLIKLGSQLGLEMLILSVFASNERAYHVYTKVGFQEVGRIPKMFYHKDVYVDEVLMVKFL